jgi:hypothetical protein
MLSVLLNVMPAIVGVLYGLTGLGYLYQRQYGWALMWLSYAMANVGIIIASQNS